MVEKDRFVVTRPLVLGLLAALALAFGAGVKASTSLFGEARARPVLAASPVPDAAVTAEQVRQLAASMSALQVQLNETIKQVGDLNTRLSKMEGAAEAQHEAQRR